jgi:cell division protein FtsL
MNKIADWFSSVNLANKVLSTFLILLTITVSISSYAKKDMGYELTMQLKDFENSINLQINDLQGSLNSMSGVVVSTANRVVEIEKDVKELQRCDIEQEKRINKHDNIFSKLEFNQQKIIAGIEKISKGAFLLSKEINPIPIGEYKNIGMNTITDTTRS